jgi:iron only hydrogenase large subunit-like protein/nitrogen-specific signal transduction histidine kinase
MEQQLKSNLVYTVKNKCRVCYTCVRECPVKAIKIINGQAEVIGDRCIACGNCVKVCSQGAKNYLSTIDNVFSLLESGKKVVACIAPSFPAEFNEITDHQHFVGKIRTLGFDKVVEVSFGADLIAAAYAKLHKDVRNEAVISSDCPAIVNYIEKYYPALIGNLAPIVSPMVATARLVKQKYEHPSVVFIGPCVAKKSESDELDEVLTFTELRQMFDRAQLMDDEILPSDFDPPYSGKGAVFPVSKGMLNTMGRCDDISVGESIVAEGKEDFKEVIYEMEHGYLDATHLELLCCEGCIMGPGMSPDGRRYKRRASISNYVRQKLNDLDQSQWKLDMERWSGLNFTREFSVSEQQFVEPEEAKIQEVLANMGKLEEKDHLNCGACGYPSCKEHAVAIIDGLAEDEMCLPYTIEKLHQSISDLNVSNEQLANARIALKQSEKLAGMGQLSAGIAHELNNPLGVITMYSNILMDETADESMKADLELIVEQADRCKKIVGGLLNFARKNQIRKSECDLVDFCRKSLNSVLASTDVEIRYDAEMSNPRVFIDTDQMMQVLTNLEKNAVESMTDGGVLHLQLKDHHDTIEIKVCDTGLGISKENMEKVFTPFFTTKGLGKGTGLGLALVYRIVKMHQGQIFVESNDDSAKGETGTVFRIVLPRT